MVPRTYAPQCNLLVGLCALSLAACSPAGGDDGPSAGSGGQAGSGTQGGSGGKGPIDNPGGMSGAAAGAGGSGGNGAAGKTAGNSGGGSAGNSGGAAGAEAPDAAVGDAASPGGETDAAAPPNPAATASEACGKGLEPPEEGIQNIQAAGIGRRFMLRIPDTYDGQKPWPVIFAFHGAGNQDATTFDRSFGFRAENESKAVLVFPESLTNNGSHTWMTLSQHPSNVAFVDAMVAWLKEKLCINPSRIFATGQSSGGYFSQTMGCQRGDLFRAVASNSGGERYFENCQGNPGVLISFGRNDQNSHTTAARKARDFWVERKSCMPDNPEPVEPSPCVSYRGCKDGIPLVYCEHGGGHPWPDYATKGFWNFFDSFK